jgi:uncharacterized membrane-anchored protein
MRTKLVISAILIQFLVLGWMAGQREWILRTGPDVWLRTAPVDPRDIFRGDYVTLRYDISNIPREKFGPGLQKHMEDRLAKHKAGNYYVNGREIGIYTALQVDPATGVAAVATADLTPPAAGLFIKGRVRPYFSDTRTYLTGVAYGIDAFYVQQGKGGELERRPVGAPVGVQVPVEMQVALGRNGTAVLKGHRWCQLGIGVQIQTREAPAGTANNREPLRKIIHLTLYNASPAALAVVLPPDLRTLHIQRLEGWMGPGEDACEPRTGLPDLTDADLRLLQPGESTYVDIDPGHSEWFVKSAPGAAPRRLGDKDMYESYRIVYEPPGAAACKDLRDAACIAHGQLAGRPLGSYELRQD